jgi:hypothetical protein
MKTKRTNYKKKLLVPAGALCIMLSTSAHANTNHKNTLGDKNTANRKHNSKPQDSKKNNIVRVMQDASKKLIHVTVKDIADKTVDFFVFDLEGTLVINYKLRSKEKKTIKNLKKGEYVYNAFFGDEEADAGNIEIR